MSDPIEELANTLSGIGYIYEALTSVEIRKVAKYLHDKGGRLVPPDHVIAPREPTEAMLAAAEETGEYGGISDSGAPERDNFDPEQVWVAMIAATLPTERRET